MFNITFPQKINQRYWSIHFEYVLNIFKELNCNIRYVDRGDSFIVGINGRDFLMDYADTHVIVETSLPVLKFHCREKRENVFPFPPVSFHNWNIYFKLEKEINYRGNSEIISNRQRAYGNAATRRTIIKNILHKRFNNNVLSTLINQEQYWREISNILIACFVPGYDNNICDRSFMQYSAFGCPSICPEIIEFLPFNKKFKNNCNYIQCAENYSDLITIIEKLLQEKHSKDYLSYIGEEAKTLFKNTATPASIGKYLYDNL